MRPPVRMVHGVVMVMVMMMMMMMVVVVVVVVVVMVMVVMMMMVVAVMVMVVVATWLAEARTLAAAADVVGCTRLARRSRISSGHQTRRMAP